MKKGITRIFAVIMALSLLLTFASCGGKEEGTTAPAGATTTEKSQQAVATTQGKDNESTVPVATTQDEADSTEATSVVKTTSAPKNDPTGYSPAQIVNYYTQACSKTMSLSRFSVKKSDTVSIKINSIEGLGVFNGAGKAAANAVIKKYAGTKTYNETFVNGKGTQNTSRTAEDFLQPAKLDAAGAKSATVVKDGNNYRVSIKVVKETSTLKSMPKYHSQCMTPLDMSTVDISPFELTSVNFTYPGGKITAVINPQGYVISQKIYMPLIGDGTGGYKALQITANLDGSFDQTITYSF